MPGSGIGAFSRENRPAPCATECQKTVINQRFTRPPHARRRSFEPATRRATMPRESLKTRHAPHNAAPPCYAPRAPARAPQCPQNPPRHAAPTCHAPAPQCATRRDIAPGYAYPRARHAPATIPANHAHRRTGAQLPACIIARHAHGRTRRAWHNPRTGAAHGEPRARTLINHGRTRAAHNGEPLANPRTVTRARRKKTGANPGLNEFKVTCQRPARFAAVVPLNFYIERPVQSDRTVNRANRAPAFFIFRRRGNACQKSGRESHPVPNAWRFHNSNLSFNAFRAA